ncbi:MAG: hypothetical protein IKK46_04355 [Clostridia bacterium]|nr:hypothetical protein [Clostridia bacterium]
MATRKEKIECPKYIDNESIVTLKDLGNIKEISIFDRLNSGATIQPISKEEFVLLSTGEIKAFQNHATNRTENFRNLERSMKTLKDLINANVTPDNIHCCRFITLTYKENMTNAEQLYQDFKNFNKRFKRYIEKLELSYEYIVSIEAQKRGAFHLHCIFIFDSSPPFIENSILAQIWGNGFVSIKALNGDVDNIGKYLTAYLTDLPIEDETLPLEVAGGKIKEVNSKRYIKNARLKLLPQGIRIYRYSKGIKKPIKTTTTYENALNTLKNDGFTKTNEFAIEITDDSRNFKSQYVKQTYKKLIKKRVDSND